MNDTVKKILKLMASAVIPLLILIIHPLGMDFKQSMIVASLLLTIIWWSTGIVKKIPASLFLLTVFTLSGAAPLTQVFSFPLSENFFLITLTYLFSQGISNSGLIDKLAQPILAKYANTPCKTIAAIIIMYLLTIYMIPQPLARLIIVAVLFSSYLSKTTAPDDTREVLMFACFAFYIVVNMSARDADIIMNNAAVGFAGIQMSDAQWISYMAVPTVVYGIAVLGIFMALFRKQLFGIRLAPVHPPEKQSALTKGEWATLAIVAATVLLWMTSAVHGINSTLITAISTAILFLTRVLTKKDFSAIDVTTLVFLTAAFSIGGVMKACGAADIVFSRIGGLFPAQYSYLYLLVMVLITMIMHMILGSNTTTLSVVIPGLSIMCGNVLPVPIIMLVAYISVAFHSLLPFHSVAMMIGNSNNYFPAKYVTRLGIPVTLLVFISALFIYAPWWRFMGFM